MNVILLNEMVCGEPGPNYYWRGKKSDFKSLLNLIQPLKGSTITTVHIRADEIFQLQNIELIEFSNNPNGRTLVEIKEGLLRTDLNNRFWIEIDKGIQLLSEGVGIVYLEFDDESFIENANWIIESIT